jgi:hypothetical protein
MRGLSDSICEARRQKVLSLVNALPEASAEVCGGGHLSFKARGKTFGYFLDDHHGDGRVALNCKTAPGVNDMLARVASDSFCSFSLIFFASALLISIDLPSAARLWISPLPILFGHPAKKRFKRFCLASSISLN